MRECSRGDCSKLVRWAPRIFIFPAFLYDPLAERPISGGFLGDGIAVCDDHRDSRPERYVTTAMMEPVNERIDKAGLPPVDWSRTVIEFVPLGTPV
tara:strand:- start:3322 stop:3609 length:288 start_codon:yes stop_codon:yes gene_type:complete